ncbi:MAG TPA: PAN domain-containing protein [Steroidobacteraceae bacterium]|nr:PAN domain-containing protein [Steroidobacteraceae bacterium]
MRIFACLIVSAIAAGLTSTPATAAKCLEWRVAGNWSLHQSNGFDVLLTFLQDDRIISGDAVSRDNSLLRGLVSGSIHGKKLKFRISWANLRFGDYEGIVDITAGEMEASGTTRDLLSFASATWKGSLNGECVSATLGDGMEGNTNRPGSDYSMEHLKSYENGDKPSRLIGVVADVRAPRYCQRACFADKKCKAWAVVFAGFNGESNRCFLKDRIPPAEQNSCCVSGVIPARNPQNELLRQP